MKSICLLALILHCAVAIDAQRQPMPPCAQSQAMQMLFARHPLLKMSGQHGEQRFRIDVLKNPNQRVHATLTLPVVIHIIHNNGPENITDAQILQAMAYLNGAYAGSQIQFCMAQRSPSNQPTNGITRDVSAYTDMSGSPTDDDAHVKDLNRWDPVHYINIWVVNSIPGPVAGYANLPLAHGTAEDGIIVEAGYFGNTKANTVVFVHEMGHYLGLYHTFEGGCSNMDCSVDGDQVCDTPPDQSTAAIGCGQSMNSCSTDAFSGFTIDQPDLVTDYMDYGSLDCMQVFTPLQSDRMHWFTENVRQSLLLGNACQPPCPALVKADFNAPGFPLTAGGTNIFTNTSVNAGGYAWSVDGIVKSNSADFSYNFQAAGSYTVKLVTVSANPLCNADSLGIRVQVICPVVAAFTPQTATINKSGTIQLTSNSSGASSYKWSVSGNAVSTGVSYSFSSAIPGVYAITIVADNGTCSTAGSGTITVIDPGDSCSTYTFRKTIGGDQSDNAWDVQTNAAGYFLLTGISRSYGPGTSAGMVTMLQPSGKISWSLTLGDAGLTRLNNGIFTADGGSVHAGINQSGGVSSVCLIKLDAGGQLEWSRKYNNGQNIGTYARAIQCSDGGYLISTSTVSGPGSPLLLLKTDPGGAVTWSKSFKGFTVVQSAMAEGAGEFLVSVLNQLTPSVYRGTVFSVDKTTGSFNWGKYYGVAGSGTLTDQLFAYQSGWLLGTMYLDNMTGLYSHGLLLLNGSGAVDQAFRIKSPLQRNGATLLAPVTVTRAGNFCFSEAITTGIETGAVLLEVSPGGELLHAKQYQLPLSQLIYSMQGTADGGLVAAGSLQPATISSDAWLIKTDSALRTACPDADFQCSVEKPVVIATPFSTVAVNLPLNMQDFEVSRIEINPMGTDACPDPALCNSIKITGQDSVCANAVVGYRAFSTEGCSQPMQWRADSAVADISIFSDDSVIVRFKKTGWLYASLQGKCKIVTDSMLIRVYQPPAPPNLGPDRLLCAQSSTELYGGNGFIAYRWQDGSSGAGYTAYLPGTYSVTATAGCGIAYSDTIVLSAVASPNFTLGGTVQKCTTNPVTIYATPGFTNYYWSPAYAINNTYSQTVTVNPVADTTYTCTAIAAGGCTVVDSVRVFTKDCVNGIFFPNSFTPNKDGSNDVFRVVVHGAMPVHFTFAIFNRLGEKVFSSTDIYNSWDGNFHGRTQAPGGYVWYCTYQFSGQPEKKEKGLLLMVR